jgi:hypothetical protein
MQPSNDIEWIMDSIASSCNVKGRIDKIRLIDLILALTVDFMIPFAHHCFK